MTRYYYSKTIENPQTGQEITLQASDRFGLSSKIEKQYERWEHERIKELKAEKKQQALDKTEEAQQDIASLHSILAYTLDINDRIDWLSFLERDPYPGKQPTLDNFAHASLSKTLSFISSFRKKANEQKTQEKAAYEKALEDYKQKQEEWIAAQKEHNNGLVRKKIAYEKGATDGVEAYISMVLDRSNYPDVININNELTYDSRTKLLLVELALPSAEAMPQVESYKYVTNKDIIEPKLMKQKDFAALYDDALYQIVLRTIHEVFESDYKEHIQSIVVNGNTNVVDKGTGVIKNKAIMTIQVGRKEFLSINLAQVDPAACFRHFKGITAGSLVELSPIRPIMKLDKKDKRIIKADNVLEEFDPTQNLATMAWEKFEVLIRDLLQSEFSGKDVAVEVTRASRDAGVDAIAFDEDPIKGGKLVIQAKRYNNLVPVSAVRDLYGTVVNEGAIKSILVTTSYYGPDAISFAKDKPLTLINGEQLLYLFQQHGHNFKIELQKKRAASYRQH